MYKRLLLSLRPQFVFQVTHIVLCVSYVVLLISWQVLIWPFDNLDILDFGVEERYSHFTSNFQNFVSDQDVASNIVGPSLDTENKAEHGASIEVSDFNNIAGTDFIGTTDESCSLSCRVVLLKKLLVKVLSSTLPVSFLSERFKNRLRFHIGKQPQAENTSYGFSVDNIADML